MKLLNNILKSIKLLIFKHPILTIFLVVFLTLIASFLNWKYGRTYYELKPTSPEGVKIVAITKKLLYPNFSSEIFIKYPNKKELVSTNLKIGGKYTGITSDDSGYTLIWEDDNTAILRWNNIMFSPIIEEVIRY